MVTVQMIVDKVREELSLLYPGCTFYIHGLPPAVSRPAFHIYLDTDRSEDNNYSLTNETTAVGIMYYPPDTDPVPEEMKALNVYDAAKSIFRKGNIQVGDRAVKIVLLRGGRQDNEIYLIVKMVYSEERPQEVTAYDLIGEIKIR